MTKPAEATPSSAGTTPRGGRFNTRVVASSAVFTAFVAAATMAFSLSIPVTSGYFNVGEIMVYTAALLMGPYVGAFAGGVGSAISDVALGYGATYAPGTLVIKAIEGFIVGYLSSRVLANLSKSAWRATTLVLAAMVGGLVVWLGLDYLGGGYELSLGFPIGPTANFEFAVPSIFWIVVGAVAFLLIVVAGFRTDEKLGWTALAVLAGGAEMVLGYFLYESFALQLGFVSAAGEVPFNVTQAVVGLLVAVPLAKSIRRVSGRLHAAV
ncbi:MAG: ECF transporter S component [Nitrososphaerota archaeon]|nr:ECF transporter S component [Nitrososphaerota archaeon]